MFIMVTYCFHETNVQCIFHNENSSLQTHCSKCRHQNGYKRLSKAQLKKLLIKNHSTMTNTHYTMNVDFEICLDIHPLHNRQ